MMWKDGREQSYVNFYFIEAKIFQFSVYMTPVDNNSNLRDAHWDKQRFSTSLNKYS